MRGDDIEILSWFCVDESGCVGVLYGLVYSIVIGNFCWKVGGFDCVG